MKNVVILNFTGLRGNWGCQATSFELLKFLAGVFPDGENLHFDFVPLLATTKADVEYDGQLDRVYDSFEAVAENGDASSLDYLTEIATQRYSKWLPALMSADLVVFQAEGSMGMGEDFAKGPRLMLLPFVAKHAWYKPVVALNQSFYSQNQQVLKNAATTFKSLDFCAFRESLSLAFAKENGVDNACLIPDLAFMARSWDADIQPREKNPNTFAVTGTALKDPNRYRVIVDQTMKIAKQTGLRPMVAVSRDYQLTLSSYLEMRKNNPMRIPRSANYVDVTKRFSQTAFLLGGRYHMAILASAGLTPCIMYQGNTFKNEGLSHLLGGTRKIRDFSDDENILKDVDAVLDNFVSETGTLAQNVGIIRTTIDRAQKHLGKALLEKGPFEFEDGFDHFEKDAERILAEYRQFGKGKLTKRSTMGLFNNAIGEFCTKSDQNSQVKRVVVECMKSGDKTFENVLPHL